MGKPQKGVRKMEDLKVLEIKSVNEIIKYLNLSSNNCQCAYYYMDDEFTSNPVIRKMENYEIHERMNYSFEKTLWGWTWKRSENAMTVDEIAQSILDIINRDY